jgi:hypothetical protein
MAPRISSDRLNAGKITEIRGTSLFASVAALPKNQPHCIFVPPFPNAIADRRSECDSAAMRGGGAAECLRRVARIAALTLIVMFGVMAAAMAAPSAHPQRIVAVGDLHGDYQAWLQIARAAGLIDTNGHWSGGKTILVQLGDVTDREPDSLKIIRSLQQLQAEAPRAGGQVVVVLGNHEAMNLLGDYRYTTAGEYAAFVDDRSVARRERVYMANRTQLEAAAHAINPKELPSEVREQWLARTPLGWVEHRLAWSPSGELGKWAAHNPAVVRIGDTLFVHGGLSAEYSKIPIDEINRRVAAAMASGEDDPKSILNDPLGPLWYRGLVGRDPDAEAARAAAPKPPPGFSDEVNTVLGNYGAKRLVIGHTPSLTGIAVTNGGKLIRIDTGISRFYGGPLSWIEIVGETVIPHTVARTQ